MRNEDIERFWSQTRSQLDEVAMNAKVEEISLSDPMLIDTHVRTRTVHEVVLASLGGVRIRAWYSVPAGEPPSGGWPAIMELPPYKEQMPLPLHLGMHGFATLSLFPRGQGLSRKESQVEVDTKVVQNVTDREKYYYRGAYMDCVRGMDFLSGRSEIDAGRIGTWGFSAGGGLSLATAALDARVKAAVASVPWPCDFQRNAQASTPPFVRVREYLERNPAQRDQVMKTLEYFDIVNLVDSIQCPVLIGGAIVDDLHPIQSTLLAYERIKSRKASHIYPDLTHEYRSDFTFNALSWMKRHL
jgi:cephalosporin-C deacetylase